MYKIFILFILVFGLQLAFAQLSVRMEYIFIDDESIGQYSGGVTIKSGNIKVGEHIKAKDDGGHEYTIVVKEITDNDTDQKTKSLAAGKSGFIVIQSVDFKKFPIITGGFTMGESAINSSISQNNSSTSRVTTCFLNRKKWEGSVMYKGASYFPKGNSLLKTNRTYLILQFSSNNSPDDRLITIQAEGFKGGKEILNFETFEFAISGSENGIKENSCILSNWVKGQANTKHTPFKLEFTKWEDKGQYIVASGNYEGTIFGLNLFSTFIGKKICEDLVITNGVFTDIMIEKI